LKKFLSFSALLQTAHFTLNWNINKQYRKFGFFETPGATHEISLIEFKV